MRFVRCQLGVLAAAVLAAAAHAAQPPLPPKPADFVLDEAGVFSPAQRRSLIAELEQFERDTSNQVVVAVIPRVPDGYVMEDFTQRTAEAWGVGRKEHDNGIVLFVFPASRELRIEVGYGLEGAVPDALANGIIQDEIIPLFRQGDMPGGIERGVRALMEASKGEYTGTGGASGLTKDEMVMLIFIIVVVLVMISMTTSKGGRSYSRAGAGDSWFSSGGGGGGYSGGGGGGFSGGGGSFGGGGASGRW